MNDRNPPCGFVLMFPQGDRYVKIINTECRSKAEARSLLSDRIAKGHAFPGEYIALNVPDVTVTRAAYSMENFRGA